MSDMGVVAALREAAGYRDLLANLVQRELRSRYRRTVLGWGWSMLQPALMTAVYGVVFTIFFKLEVPVGTTSGIKVYAFFLLAGLLPWNFFTGSLTTAMGTIVNAGNLVTRVWFPRLLLPLASILALAFSLCIELTILVAVISLVTWTMLLHLLPVLVVLIALEVVFTSGIAFWLAACNVRFRDVEYIVTVLLLVYLYMTPVLYPIGLIPDGTIGSSSITWRDVLLVNPMARFTMAFRNVLYDATLPGLPTMLWLVAWSGLTFYLGTRFFLKRSDRFAEMM
jgi:lipopolysaccharide transport system permease protein